MPILNIEAGRVVVAGPHDANGYGIYVEIRCGSGHTHQYGHLSGVNVAVGDYVAAADVLGWMGNTGKSTGTHLHWRVIGPDGSGIDPLTYMPPAELPDQLPEPAQPQPRVIVVPFPLPPELQQLVDHGQPTRHAVPGTGRLIVWQSLSAPPRLAIMSGGVLPSVLLYISVLCDVIHINSKIRRH